jgi:hypothetical protein
VTRPARLLRALPWAALALAVLIFYWTESSLRKTPWLFTDELEWSQLSRGIASTGHAARRGEPHSFESLYSFLIAPVWWIHSTATAYAAIKYLNATVMCLTALPAYALARMLLPRRPAVVVALLSIAVPAMSYATSIVPEPLAYLWFTAAALAAVRALAAPGLRTAVLAVALAAVGVLVRLEFVVLPASLVLAAAVTWVLAHRDRLSLARIAAACAGLALFAFVFNVLVVERVQSWTVGQYFNHETITQGGLAAGALAIGLGLLPLVGGLGSLWVPERFDDPAYRAFAVYLAASIVTICVYTAAKAAYLVSSLQPRIEERNLFFLSPLLLAGTALCFGARRLNWPLLLAAAVLSLLISWSGMFIVPAPYFEAPGLSVATLVNRDFRWDVNALHYVLIGAALVSLALLALRHRRAVPAVAAVLAAAWLLTGEIYATQGNDDEARVFAQKLPPPRSWVDEAVHGRGVTFLAQAVTDGNPLWLTEFWNRSVNRVGALNGVAPGPGPIFGPGLETTGGRLSDYDGDPYTLAAGDFRLDAPILAQRDGFTLYSTPATWHLLDEVQNVYTDGWATSPILYTYFRPGGSGVLTVSLSRSAYTGPGPVGHATIRVGTVALDRNGTPVLRRQTAVCHAAVRNGALTKVRIPVAATPVTVSIDVTPPFSTPTDSRLLAAQPGFRFRRGAHAPPCT